MMNQPKVIQVCNLVKSNGFSNPQRGRVYSTEGIAPCLMTCGGGQLEPKVLIYDEETDTEDTASDHKGLR